MELEELAYELRVALEYEVPQFDYEALGYAPHSQDYRGVSIRIVAEQAPRSPLAAAALLHLSAHDDDSTVRSHAQQALLELQEFPPWRVVLMCLPMFDPDDDFNAHNGAWHLRQHAPEHYDEIAMLYRLVRPVWAGLVLDP